jgi:hypothetical protein
MRMYVCIYILLMYAVMWLFWRLQHAHVVKRTCIYSQIWNVSIRRFDMYLFADLTCIYSQIWHVSIRRFDMYLFADLNKRPQTEASYSSVWFVVRVYNCMYMHQKRGWYIYIYIYIYTHTHTYRERERVCVCVCVWFYVYTPATNYF